MRARRSCLSVPGSSPKFLAKAATLPADEVFFDLEDSVAPLEKEAARGNIVEALKTQGHEVERAQIRMPQGPLKQVGDYPLQIVLHTDVTATITVSVLGEQ